MELSAMISINEFKRVEMKVGRVVHAEKVKGSDKLLKLKVSFGDVDKQVLTGLANLYPPEHFIGRQFVFVTNLESRKIRGEVSEAMLLTAVESDEVIVPVTPEKTVKDGTLIL
uniref:Methionine--tRNA ligase n=1 Tax=Caldiarchaeum subterraneum TaxID=311458 RepID=A0A7C5U462_CALS0